MKIYGAFLCFGPDADTQVQLLDNFTLALLGRQLTNADDSPVSDDERRRVYRKLLGGNFEWAVPCWSDTLLAVIENEAFPKPVRVIAARIYQGLPYSRDGGAPADGKSGGAEADLEPVKPKPRKPSGGNAVHPDVRRRIRSMPKAPAEARA